MSNATDNSGFPVEVSNYQIKRLLDRGGMGSVYLAEQQRPKRDVAIKIISPDDLPKANAEVLESILEMLQREGDIAARFDHESLITVYECGIDQGNYYLAMEYLPGGNLRERIGQGMKPEDATNIVRRIASGLADMHAEGILHRDIKPENVMFRRNGKPVLMDYGVAKDEGTISKLTQLGLSTGTPDYMSPEQVDDSPVDLRSDLYALGVLFYEMLTGEVPFPGNSQVAIAYAHVHNPVPRLPEGLEAYQRVVDRLLAKAPEDRLQTAVEVVEALQQIGPGNDGSSPPAPSVATRITPVEPSQKPRQVTVISELKRRKVLRAAGFYGVTAFGLTEVITFLFDSFSAPAWATQMIAALFVIGFPVAMFLAWAFDIEPGGHLRRTRFQGRRTAPILLGAALLLVLSTGGLFYLIYPRGELAADSASAPGGVATAPVSMTNTLAILPFDNRSPDPANEYLSGGMADTLLSHLQVLDGIKVISTASMGSSLTTSTTDTQLGQQLGVSFLLKGSVQKIGDNVRILPQLVQAATGDVLWANTFTKPIGEFFDLQDQVAEAVIIELGSSLEVQLQVAGQARPEAYQPSLQAYEQLVLGRSQLNEGTVESLAKAVEFFHRSIELDPNYAVALVNLADAYSRQDTITHGLQDTYSGLPSKQARELMEPLIEKALALDPLSGEAHAISASMQPNSEEAEKSFKKALELAPNYAPAYVWYSNFLLLRVPRYEESLTLIQKAAELDPLSPEIRAMEAKLLWSTGRAEQALAMIIENVKRDPDFPVNYKLMARWKMQKGRHDEAMRWILKLREIDPHSPSHWGEFGGECALWVALGDQEAFSKCNSEFIAAFPDSITALQSKGDAIQFRSDASDQVAELLEQVVEDEPGNLYRVAQLIFRLEVTKKYDRLLEVARENFPELFAEPAAVNPLNIWPLTLAANAACKSGQQVLCDQLVDAGLEATPRMRLILGGGFLIGTENVQFLALKGEKEAAIREFRRIVDEGWRFSWEFTLYSASLSSIANEPEFIEILEEVRADIDQKRQLFYETRNDPLF
jgi:TolB-like protein